MAEKTSVNTQWFENIVTAVAKPEKRFVASQAKKYEQTEVFTKRVVEELMKTQNLIFDDKLEGYKNYQRIAYQRRTLIKDWQSNSVSNFTQLLCDIIFQKTYGIPFNAPIKAEGELADTIEAYISTCWAAAKMQTKIAKAWQLAITMGDCFYRGHIRYYETDIKSYKSDKEKPMMTIKNFNANADVVDAVCFLYDFLKWPEESSIFIYRWWENPTAFFERWAGYSAIAKEMQDPKNTKRVECIEYGTWFSAKNFENYKLMKYKEKFLCEQDQLFWYDMADFFNVADQSNQFTDKEVLEFYTKDKIILWFNWVVIDEIKNPYSSIFGDDIWHPYCRVVNKFMPGTEISVSLPEQLIDMQYMRDLVENAFCDQIKIDLNPMYIASDNLYFEWSDDGILWYEPNKIIKAAGTGKIDKFAITNINANIFTITDYVDNRGYSTAWVNRTTAAVGWATPRSAADANYQYEITYDNLRTYAANNSQALNKLSRVWIIDGYYKLPEKVQASYKDKKFQIEKAIKEWNLDYNIEFSNETLDAYFMTQHRSGLEAVIRTAGPYQKNSSDGMDNYDIRWIMQAWLKSYSLGEFALDTDAAKKRYEEQIKLKTELWVKEAISTAEWQAEVAQVTGQVNPNQWQPSWPNWDYSPEQKAAYAARWLELANETQTPTLVL